MIAIFDPPALQGLSFSSRRNSARPWRVDTDHSFRLTNARTGELILQMRIEAPLDTDLASIPWYLGWAMPRNGWHIRGCVFHDEAYKRQGMPRVLADFGLRMIHDIDRPVGSISYLQMWIVWAGLRLTGWWAWRQNGKALRGRK